MRASSTARALSTLLGIGLLAAPFGLRPVRANVALANKTFKCSSANPCVTASNGDTQAGDGIYATSPSLNGIQGVTSGIASGVYGFNAGVGNGIEGYAEFGTSDSSQAILADGDKQAVPLILSNGSSYGYFFNLFRVLDFCQYTCPVATVEPSGRTVIQGSLYSAGSCRNGCASTRRRVVSYGTAETEPTLEDAGEAQLRDGVATVSLDATLAGSVGPGGYSVLLTAEGDNEGLYVEHRTASSFVVRERGGGRSSIPFAYRIVVRAAEAAVQKGA